MSFEYVENHLTRVRSDEGFEVRLVRSDEIAYCEGNREMRLYFEFERDQSQNHVIALGTNGLNYWLPPFHLEMVSVDKQAEIRARIEAAFEFTGMKCRFFAGL